MKKNKILATAARDEKPVNSLVVFTQSLLLCMVVKDRHVNSGCVVERHTSMSGKHSYT